MATMNISLPDEMKTWVENQVGAKFGNTSDVMRDLVRKEQEREKFVAEVRQAIAEAEASGFIPYDRKEIEERLGIKPRSHAA